MKNFDDYLVIDFIMNDSFVQWASGASIADDEYWTSFPLAHPNKAEVFNQAKEIVLHLQVVPVRNLSHNEVDELIRAVLQKNNLNTPEIDAPKVIRLKWHQNKWFKIAAALLLCMGAMATIYLNQQHVTP